MNSGLPILLPLFGNSNSLSVWASNSIQQSNPEPLIDSGELFSIVKRRQKIKEELCHFFDFEKQDLVFDFLFENKKIRDSILEITNLITQSIKIKEKPILSILDEEGINTLFFTIKTSQDWKEISVFKDQFYDNLIAKGTDIFDYVNINVIPV